MLDAHFQMHVPDAKGPGNSDVTGVNYINFTAHAYTLPVTSYSTVSHTGISTTIRLYHQ